MNRRRLLGRVAALVTGVSVAGCSGADEEVPEMAPPAPGGNPDAEDSSDDRTEDDEGESGQNGLVTIQNYDALEGENGNLVVTITVRNENDQQQVRFVRALVTMGDSELPVGAFVSLAPRATETVELSVDVQYEAWFGNGGFTPAVVARTPTTPLPTDTQTASETTSTTSETRKTADAGDTGTDNDAGTEPATAGA